MSKEVKKTRKLGRPTKYHDKIPSLLLEHFNIPLYYKTTEQKMSASGAVENIEVTKASDMPTFEGFAVKLMVNIDTLHEWRSKHKPFSEAYRICKGIQKNFLMAHGLNGNYNSAFAKFIAVNCTDLVDTQHIKQENEITVKDYGLAFDLSKTPEQIEAENKKISIEEDE